MQTRQWILGSGTLCSYLALAGAGCVGPAESMGSPDSGSVASATSAVSGVQVESCRGEPDVELAIARWPGVPTEDAVATLSTGSVTLALDNLDSQLLVAGMKGIMMAGGQRVELDLGTVTLGAGSTVNVTVPLGGFGIDISSLTFSGSVFIDVTLRDVAGGLVRRTFSPTRFFHTSRGRVLVYGASRRSSHYNGGDLRGQIVTAAGPEIAGIFDGGTGAGQMGQDTGPLLVSAGNPAGGPNTWELCLRWTYQSTDSGFQLPGGISEDYYTSGHLMKARGMKVRIEHPSWMGVPKDRVGSLDNGCVTFDSTENTGFVLTLFAESHVGATQNLTLKGFKDAAARQANQVTQWKVLASPGGAPRRVYYQTEASDVANLLAFGSFTAFWVDSHTDPGIEGTSTLGFVTQVVNDPNCTEACKSGDALWFKPGAVTREKFGVAHEVGHWLHSQWTAAGPSPAGNPYTESGDPVLEPLCAYSTPVDGPGGHAIRSREHSHGAYNEGVGHFIAALAWNDPDQKEGLFKYYKDGITSSSYDDMKYTDYLVSLEGEGVSPMGGPSDWFHTHCLVSDGYAVEMDWLRFLWDYRTNDPAEIDQSVPTNFDVFSFMQFTKANHGWTSLGGVHDAYEAAWAGDASGQPAWFEERWMTLAAQNGVAQ